MPCASRLAINQEAFRAAITIGLAEEMKVQESRVPIIHISAHGDTDGIQLSDGSRLTWDELKDLLVPINAALQGVLLVCMSCCHGYAGIRMAMSAEDEPMPYFAIIGNGDTPRWAETAIGFASFYHHLANGKTVTEAVEYMRVASGNDEFYLRTAEEARRSYIDFVSQLDLSQAPLEIEEQIAVSQEPDDTQRMNELEKSG